MAISHGTVNWYTPSFQFSFPASPDGRKRWSQTERSKTWSVISAFAKLKLTTVILHWGMPCWPALGTPRI